MIFISSFWLPRRRIFTRSRTNCLAGPRVAHAHSFHSEEMVVSDDSCPDYRFRQNPQLLPSNAVSGDALSTINPSEDHAEQQIGELPGQRPPSRSPPCYASEDLFDRVKGIPTLLVLRKEVIPTDVRMADKIDHLHWLQPESSLCDSSLMFWNEIRFCSIL